MNFKASLSVLASTINTIRGISFNTASLDTYVISLRGLSDVQARVALSSAGLEKTQQRQILNKLAEAKATTTLTTSEALEAMTKETGNKEAAFTILQKAKLITADTLEADSLIHVTKAEIEAAVASGALTTAEGNQLISALGLTSGNLGLATSFKLLAKQISVATAELMRFLFLTPEGWAVLAVTAIVGATIAYAKWGDTLENSRKKLSKTKDEYDEVKSKLQSVNDELKTTQQRLAELNGKDTLTFAEQDEYNRLVATNHELERKIHLLEQEERAKSREKRESFSHTIEKERADFVEPPSGAGGVIETYWGAESQYEWLKGQGTINESTLDEAEQKILKDVRETAKRLQEEAAGIEYIPSPSTEDEKKANEALDFVNDFQDKLAIALNGEHAKSDTFNRLVDNWQFDEATQELQDLGKEGKVTFDMLKERVNDTSNTAFQAFINKLIELGVISDTTDGSLRYLVNAFNGVGNAAASYVKSLGTESLEDVLRVSDSAAESMKELKEILESSGEAAATSGGHFVSFGRDIDDVGDKTETLIGEVKDAQIGLENEAKSMGITKSELAKLISAHILFNNTSLNTDSKQAAFINLATAISRSSNELRYLLKLFNAVSNGTTISGADVREGSIFDGFLFKAGTVIDNVQIDPKKILEQQFGISSSLFDIPEKTSGGVGSGGSGSSSKGSGGSGGSDSAESDSSKKEVEEYTAEIEKFAEAQQELNDAQERGAALDREISREKNPSRQLALQRERITAYEDEQQALHDLNEVRRTYINDQVDLLRERGFEVEYSPETNRLYISNMEHINELVAESKGKYESLQEATNAYRKENEELIKSITSLNEENKKSSEEWDKVRESIEKAKAEALSTSVQAIEKVYNREKDRIDRINEGIDDQIKKYQGLQKIMTTAYDASNDLLDAQHEIDKSIADSRISKSYLNPSEYAKIFNEEDYQKVSDAIDKTKGEISVLTSDFHDQVLKAYANDQAYLIEHITAEYERQVELKKQEIEIVKAELDYTKKQTELNNVLSERNIKQLVERNGKFEFEWVADQDKVKAATEELADAQYNLEKATNKRAQQIETDQFERQIEDLEDIQNANNYKIKKFGEAVDLVKTNVDNLQNPIISFGEAIDLLRTTGIQSLSNALTALEGEANKNGISVGGGNSSSFGSNLGLAKTNATATIPGVGTVGVTINSSGKTTSSLPVGTVVHTNGGDYKITGGTAGNYSSVKVKDKYASGTKNTVNGYVLMGEEEDELYISSDGRLIPITSPTIANVAGGGSVFNAEQMKNVKALWDMSNLDILSSGAMNAISTSTNSQSISNKQYFGDIVINNPSDFNDFVRQFKNAIQRKTV